MSENKSAFSYVLLSDSTTDLSAEMAEKIDVNVIPLTFTIGGVDYKNDLAGKSMDPKTFYDRMRAGETAVTSQVNVAQFEEFFEPYLQDGLDVYYMAFSSALSGTCNSARMAAESLQKKYPERRILASDTLCASLGEGLLVYHAAKRRLDGMSLDDLYTWVEENKGSLCHWFTVDDLVYLKRGGRVSAAAALVGTMLGIKPVMHVDDEGRLVPVEKVRGRRKSLDAMLDHMEQTAILPADQTVFICHGDCIKDVEYLCDQLKSRMNVKDIYYNYTGPVIGSHSGPGTIAVFFLGSKR